MPSQPVAGLAVTLIGMAYTLVVPGKHRYQAKWAIGIILGPSASPGCTWRSTSPPPRRSARSWAWRSGSTAFRWFTPNDVFPVTYRRGKAAHLDVGGARGEAIVRAAKDQLGLDVIAIKPVGLGGVRRFDAPADDRGDAR